jgi:hypothetical protein
MRQRDPQLLQRILARPLRRIPRSHRHHPCGARSFAGGGLSSGNKAIWTRLVILMALSGKPPNPAARGRRGPEPPNRSSGPSVPLPPGQALGRWALLPVRPRERSDDAA